MSDLSLVLESFSLVLGSCSADSKFATFLSVFATMLQRYEEFLNYASFFAIIFPKIAKKYPSRGEWQFPRERAATSLHFISKQAPGALVIPSLCYFMYSFMVRYPPFCPRNIQVFIYSSRTRRFSELGKLDEVKVYKL